jgi:glycoside/pentoside/hexuronide:cation symporter, GPH family
MSDEVSPSSPVQPAAHGETAPEDRVGFFRMVLYGCGGFVNNTLSAAIGGMLIVLNLGLGMDPAWVGLVGAFPRLIDAIIDPVMGYISDHTKSRWGRRRPYIFIGAILSGLVYMGLWWIPRDQSEIFYLCWFLIGSTLFYVAYTVFVAPWVAMGYELTPDYHERTRLMGVQNFIGQLAYVVSPWFLWFMTNKSWFRDQVEGARWLAILIGVVAIGLGVLPAVFLRERLADSTHDDKARPDKGQDKGSNIFVQNLKDFAHGLKTTVSSGPFLKLSLATFLVFNGFILISSFQSYVIIYYVFGGNQELGAKWAGYSGTTGAVSTFLVIIIVTWLGTKIGKRHAFFVSTAVSMVGYAMKWFSYNPEIPWLLLLPAPLMAFGLGGLFTLMGSMIADVVDADELKTHERREGMYGSIFWWVVKMGMAAALAGGGFLLNATGFKVDLGGQQAASTITLMRLADCLIPLVASGIAIWAVWSYPITEQTARETRKQLEQRRGARQKTAEPSRAA